MKIAIAIITEYLKEHGRKPDRIQVYGMHDDLLGVSSVLGVRIDMEITR
jgi:hypothetical protein